MVQAPRPAQCGTLTLNHHSTLIPNSQYSLTFIFLYTWLDVTIQADPESRQRAVLCSTALTQTCLIQKFTTITGNAYRDVSYAIALHQNANYTYVDNPARLSSYLVSVVRHHSGDLPDPYFVISSPGYRSDTSPRSGAYDGRLMHCSYCGVGALTPLGKPEAVAQNDTKRKRSARVHQEGSTSYGCD